MSEHTILSPEIAPQTATQPSLADAVRIAVVDYLAQHRGQTIDNLYNVIVDQVEHSLFEEAMKAARGNQSKVARWMGLARGTLRTKLKKYFDTTRVGKSSL